MLRRNAAGYVVLGDFPWSVSALHVAKTIDGMRVPTFGLHALKGDLKGTWAVTVRANWRVIFRFEDGHACDVDLVDYH